jgi:hypothetical protein
LDGRRSHRGPRAGHDGARPQRTSLRLQRLRPAVVVGRRLLGGARQPLQELLDRVAGVGAYEAGRLDDRATRGAVGRDHHQRDDAGAGAALVDDVKKHVDEIAETVTGIQQQLDAIGPKLNAVEKLADPAVLEMLDWLARNREAIDVLLTLGETVDDEATTDAAEKPADEQAGS